MTVELDFDPAAESAMWIVAGSSRDDNSAEALRQRAAVGFGLLTAASGVALAALGTR
jgi:hypothetical protein